MLDGGEGDQGAGWSGDRDLVADRNGATEHDDGHDAGTADEATGFVAIEHRSHQARLELVKLQAGVAKASQSKQDPVTNP